MFYVNLTTALNVGLGRGRTTMTANSRRLKKKTPWGPSFATRLNGTRQKPKGAVRGLALCQLVYNNRLRSLE
jgi:hypothetical protein